MVKSLSAEEKNLAIMAKTSNYNEWIYDNIKRHIGSTVLEVGGGIGSMTQFYIDRKKVVTTDVSDYNIKKLKERFKGKKNFTAVKNDISKSTKGLGSQKFKSVVCINVLEHIGDDVSALNNMRSVLEKNGRLVLVLPAFQGLYGTVDESDNHYRRYNKTATLKKLEKAGFRPSDIRFSYMNVPGFFGWYYHGRILKKKVHIEEDLSLFDRLVPLFKTLEKIFKPWFGLSLIAICRKKD